MKRHGSKNRHSWGGVYILVAVGVSFCFWDCLSRGEPSVSATIRNLVLIWGAPLATGLAVWRSIVAQWQSEAAQKQVEVTQAGLLSNRYQRAVEMIGNNLISVRLGGIQALRNIALEHSDEYQQEVRDLLAAYYSSHGSEGSEGSEGRTGRVGRVAAGRVAEMLPSATEKRARQREEREERERQLEEQERQKAILAIDEHEKRLS